MKIPEKQSLFNAYLGTSDVANKLAGIVDEVPLPTFKNKSETLSLAGMAGEIDSPSVGNFESCEIEITFANMSKESVKIVRDDSVPIILRSAQEQLDTEKLSHDYISRVITIKGMTKEFNCGKLKKGGYGEVKVKKEVIYYKDEIDGEVITEIDKFNGKFIVDGLNLTANLDALI